MKMNDQMRQALARFGVPESVADHWSPGSVQGVAAKGQEIIMDGPVVSDMEAAFWESMGVAGFVTPSAFRSALLASPGNITLRINSPGGSVFDASVIQALVIERQKVATVSAIVDGLAASAASFIAMTAEPIKMAPMAMIMVHRSSVLAAGNAEGLRKSADILDKIDENLVDMLAEASDMSVNDAQAAIEAETWYSAKDALELGIADEILSKDTNAGKKAASARARFANVAAQLAL